MRTHLWLLKAAVPGVLVSQPFRRPSSPPARKQSPSPLVRRHAVGAHWPFLGRSHAHEDVPTRAGCHRQASPRGSHLCAIVSSHAAEKKGETGATPAGEGQEESRVQGDQPRGLSPSDPCRPEPAWLHPSALGQTCLQEAPQTPAAGDTFPCVLKRKVPCSLAVKGLLLGKPKGQEQEGAGAQTHSQSLKKSDAERRAWHPEGRRAGRTTNKPVTQPTTPKAPPARPPARPGRTTAGDGVSVTCVPGPVEATIPALSCG